MIIKIPARVRLCLIVTPTLPGPIRMEPEPPMSHLDAELTAAYLEHRLSGARLVATEDHLASCSLCRAEVAQLSPLLRGRSRRRFMHVGGMTTAAAAAAAVLLIVASSQTREGSPADAHRAGSAPIGAAVELVAPKGADSPVQEWRWRPSPGADRYELTVFDADGRVVWDTSTAQTVVTARPSSLKIGRQYFWRVRARIGWDSWVSSEFAEFTPGGNR